MATSGSACPKCGGGQLVGRTGKTSGESHTTYLRCNQCGHRDKEIKRAEMVLRRACR